MGGGGGGGGAPHHNLEYFFLLINLKIKENSVLIFGMIIYGKVKRLMKVADAGTRT